jgi:carboxyl-terminal processing protease
MPNLSQFILPNSDLLKSKHTLYPIFLHNMRMKSKSLWLWLAFSLVALDTAQAIPLLMPLEQQPQAAFLSAEVLSRYSYKRINLDDEFSSQIFDNYLKALDGEKQFFLQSDIDHFANARTRLDDAILNKDLSVPFGIYNIYQQRIAERFTYARSLLKKGFDFDKKESLQLSRKDAPWPKTAGELNDLWRKRVKNDWLRLKLAGKDDKSIIETLDKRYDNYLDGLSKVKSEDAFQNFMNAYAMSIDPHTNYLGVRASEELNIAMQLSLVGIGAELTYKDEYTTVKDLLAGGPAALSGRLKAGDRIVGVGQGEDGPMVDVVGWRIDDVVAIIRGTEDTVVRLDILPAESGNDGKHNLVSLVRKKITLDKQAAKKSIIEVKDGSTTRRIGVISLHGFYQDFAARQRGDKDYKSATRDVAVLLGDLKKEKVDAVLVDLRNNGGGSLDEAIELTGLFVGKVPVLQQRDSKGNVAVLSDDHSGLAWDGPMGVLINRGSASASEIFTAAIQDYGRGVVIGETSFGKGTVQTVADLDELAKNDKPEYGDVKVTIAQFFRINGGTTQLRGVTPDISLPSLTDPEEFGESSFDNALPWTQIRAAEYTPEGNLTSIMPMLVASHNKRISHDRDFSYLQEDIAEVNKLRRANLISLNEADRRKERDAQEAREKSREKDSGNNGSGKASAAPVNHTLQDDGMLSSERDLSDDLAMEKANKKAKDILLYEAAHVVSDEAGLLKTDPKLEASISP